MCVYSSLISSLNEMTINFSISLSHGTLDLFQFVVLMCYHNVTVRVLVKKMSTRSFSSEGATLLWIAHEFIENMKCLSNAIIKDYRDTIKELKKFPI